MRMLSMQSSLKKIKKTKNKLNKEEFSSHDASQTVWLAS